MADLDSPDRAVRMTAVHRLAQLKDPEAIPFLILRLDDADGDVRGHARWALTEIGIAAVGPLVGAIPAATPAARVQMLRALGDLRSAAGEGAAIAALSDPDRAVRRAAADALRFIVEPSGVVPLARPAAPPLAPEQAATLVAALGAEEGEVRLAAAIALGEHRNAPAADVLRARLRDGEEDASVRGAAAIALGRLRDVRYRDDLVWLRGQEERDGDLAGYAELALGELGEAAPGGSRR